MIGTKTIEILWHLWLTMFTTATTIIMAPGVIHYYPDLQFGVAAIVFTESAFLVFFLLKFLATYKTEKGAAGKS